MQFSLIQPAIYSLMQYKCWSASCNLPPLRGKGIRKDRARSSLGWLRCPKQKRLSFQLAPACVSLRPQQQWVVQMASSTSLCVCTCPHTMYIYIFIYLYKHYICIHTIYVIYNICIMHINSNKCICVIFKIEQLYLEKW